MSTELDTFKALRTAPTEDEVAFGRGKWVHCTQHRTAHLTGWCGVPNKDKIALEATTLDEAYVESRLRFH